MFAPFFFQGTGDPTPRDIVGKSLRFRGGNTLNDGTPVLSNSNIKCNAVFTWSAWVKLANTDNMVFFFSQNRNAISNPPPGEGPVFYIRQGIVGFYTSSQSLTTFTGDPLFSDPSAWYHMMITEDNTTQTLYVNGVAYSTTSNIGVVNGQSTAPFQIGSAWRESSYACGDFYLSDVYFIDGQVLPPTTFAKYDDNGVWVPIINDSLKAPGGVYSNFLFTFPSADTPNYDSTDRDFYFEGPGASGPPTYAFDGNPDTEATTAYTNDNTGAWVIFRPSDPIVATTSVQVRTAFNAAISVNGVETGLSSPSTQATTVDISSALTFPVTIENIAVRGTPPEGSTPSEGRLHQIIVDGKVLVDSTIYEAGLSTSPAGSYVTTGRTTNNLIAPEQAFNGNLADQCQAPGAGAWLYWETNLNCSTVQLYENNDPDQLPAEVYINGQQVAVPSSTLVGSNYVTSFEVPDGKLTEFAFANTGNSANTSIWGMSIDNGPILVDGASAGYGANGFHLQFADRNNIGLDTSGNGNDFTATGFDLTLYASGDYNHDSNAFDTNTNTVPTANGGAPYWIDIVPVNGSTDWTYGPAQGWSQGNVSGAGTDGTNATYMYGEPINGLVLSMNFDLRDFPTVNSVSIYAGWNQAGDNQGGAVFQLLDANKNVIPNTQQLPIRIGNSSQKYTLCTSDVGARYINFDQSAQGSYYFLYGIEVNGQILTQGSAFSNSDYDSMQDSPTQNWATANPSGYNTLSNYGKTVSLTDANLGADASSYAGFIPTSGYLSEGKWAYQFNVTPASVNYIGIVALGSDWQNCPRPDYPGWSLTLDTSAYVGYAQVYAKSTQTSGQGAATQITYGTTSPNGTPIPVILDIDNHRIRWDIAGVEGEWIDYEQYLPANTPVAFYCSIYSDSNFDYGQQAYIPPSGFTLLQTQNLPTATIPDGREYFRAIEAPGTGYTVYNEGGDSDPNRQQAAILTDKVGTTPTGAFQTSSVIYDMGGLVTSAAPGFQGSGGYWTTSGVPQFQPITTLVSADGTANSWTQVDEGVYDTNVDYYITINTSTPFRYVRMRKNTINNNLAIAKAGYGGILDVAQNAFPKGLYWIKDMENANQWQFVSFMTGLGSGTINSEYLTSTSGFDGDFPSTNAFDGSTTTRATSSTVGSVFTWNPPTDILFSDTLKVWGGNNAGQTLQLNGGTEITLDANAFTTIVASGGGTIETITINGNSNTAKLTAIEVDGQILTDNVYSNYLTATVGSIINPGGSILAFNGSLDDSDGRVYTNANDQLTWAPEPGVTFNSLFEIYNTNAASQQDITWNGNTVDPTGGWVTVATGSGTIDSSLPLVIQGIGGGRAEIYAVRIDGEQLLDPGLAASLQSPAGGALAPYVPPSGNSIAYCWNSVNDPVINTNGTTPSRVSADPESGFSIVKYKGTGTNSTIGHGLNTAPELVIYKKTNGTNDFGVYAKPLTPSYYLRLNTAAAQQSASTTFNETAPNATVLSTGGNDLTNNLNDTYVAYCFAPVPGFSAVGTYVGNNNVNGPYIHTGFKPAFVLYKCTTSGQNWQVRDAGRNPNNPLNSALYTNSTVAQTTNSNNNIYFMANGFQIANADGDQNLSSGTFVWIAFASNPFGSDNTSPATAY